MGRLSNLLGIGFLVGFVGCSYFHRAIVFSKLPNEPEIRDCFNRAYEIEYVKDGKGNDYWQGCEETKKRGKGDCEDKTICLKDCLLNEYGIELSVKFGHLNIFHKNSKGYWKNGHSWVECELGETLVLDPTTGLIGEKKKLGFLNYLLVKKGEYQYLEFKINEFEKRSGLKLE